MDPSDPPSPPTCTTSKVKLMPAATKCNACQLARHGVPQPRANAVDRDTFNSSFGLLTGAIAGLAIWSGIFLLLSKLLGNS